MRSSWRRDKTDEDWIIFDKKGADDEVAISGPKIQLLFNTNQRIDAYGLLG